MKKLIMLVAVLFMIPSVVCAAEELDEKMPVYAHESYYQPHVDAGKKARAEGNYAEAIGHFNKAAENTAFAYVRAIRWGDIGQCYLMSAEKVKSKSDLKDALALYKNALALMDRADVVCGNGCVHETDCTKNRKFFRGVFERGIASVKKLLKR